MRGRTLVLGESGQLARALARLNDSATDIVCVGRAQFDLAARAPLQPLFENYNPTLIINAAAYTSVDQAETNAATARLLNFEVPSCLARECAARDLPFIHISTDYVFDGAKSTPYVETDAKNPQNVYGRSKSDGEDAVSSSGARAAIIRTSWVYDASGQNFVRTMLRLAKDRDEIRVVADQIGRPTWAHDLAHTALQLGQRLEQRDSGAEGVTHYCSADDATWAALAQAAMDEAEKRAWPSARIVPITTKEFPTPAKRPMNSRLDCTRAMAMGLAPRNWREALAACFDEMA